MGTDGRHRSAPCQLDGMADTSAQAAVAPRFPPGTAGQPAGEQGPSARPRFGPVAPGGWQAYPLPVREIGKPHLLEIEYPSHLPQSLGISIIEPNAAGKVVPLGLDSGLHVSEVSSGEQPALLRHQLVFWPRTHTPLVLLTNRSDTGPAEYGRIRVLAGPAAPPAAAEVPQADASSSRLLAAYFDQPLFPENFGALEGADEWSGRSLKDWVTFLEGERAWWST